jgi:hypothetical protein
MELDVDVAGLRLRVTSASADDLDLIRRVVGVAATDGRADATLVVDDVGPRVPDREPDFRGPYGEHWDDGVTHWFRHHWGLTAEVHPPRAWIGGPVAGHRRWVMVRNSMLFVLARLVLVQGRFLLHGAAVRRDDGALLVVGPSGSGKSSLAFAAHAAGWDVCADDMVIVDPHAARVAVQGVSRVPTLPADVAAGVDGEALPEDTRDRLELTWFTLDARAASIDAVVVCGHDGGDGDMTSISSATALQALVPALVLSALPQPVTRWFPVAARLARGPCFQLLHAADPATRLARAGDLLAQAWDAAHAPTGPST